MGIHDLKEQLRDVPDIHTLTMSYDEGGKVQVFSTDTAVARLHANATPDEIRAALIAAGEPVA